MPRMGNLNADLVKRLDFGADDNHLAGLRYLSTGLLYLMSGVLSSFDHNDRSVAAIGML